MRAAAQMAICALLAGAITSCGSDSAPPGQNELQAALLTLEDVPEDWVVRTAEIPESFPELCVELAEPDFAVLIELPKSSIGESGVTEILLSYESDAEDAFSALIAAEEACEEPTSTDRGAYTLEPLDFPRLGDESVAFEVYINYSEVTTYQALFRQGDIVAHVSIYGLPSSDLERYARLGEARLAEVLQRR